MYKRQGEESAGKIQGRAQRLGISDAKVDLAIETELSNILAALKEKKPDIAIIDSIQTLWTCLLYTSRCV